MWNNGKKKQGGTPILRMIITSSQSPTCGMVNYNITIFHHISYIAHCKYGTYHPISHIFFTFWYEITKISSSKSPSLASMKMCYVHQQKVFIVISLQSQLHPLKSETGGVCYMVNTNSPLLGSTHWVLLTSHTLQNTSW